MYGLLPGWSQRRAIQRRHSRHTGRRNDSITVIYADYNFPLGSISYLPDTTTAHHGETWLRTHLCPGAPGPTPPAVWQAGDLVMFSNSRGNAWPGHRLTANSMTFANLDALNINQERRGLQQFADGHPRNVVAKHLRGCRPANCWRPRRLWFMLSGIDIGERHGIRRQACDLGHGVATLC